MNISLDLIQTTTLAVALLLLGEFARRRIGFLQRFSIPGPVIGGFAFALAVLALRETGVAQLELDTTLQDPAMIAFFTTIGLGASVSLLRKGGKLLIVYLLACWTLAILQNVVGIGMATALGLDPVLGVMAGAVALEGGHGAAAAFGPTAEALGTDGATAVAIAAATFGLVAGGLLGGPMASWLMKRHGVKVPSGDEAAETGAVEVEEKEEPVGYGPLVNTAVLIGAVMVAGVALGTWFSETTGFVLPSYVGAMVVAAVVRNVGDRFGLRMHQGALSLVSSLSLGLFLTMAMMSLRIWDLYALALPLVLLLAVQVIVLLLFVALVVFRLLGKNYDATTMAAGMVGHGLGGTPNAMANMDAFNRRFGVRSEKAFLIVPLAGAVLIDIVALPWIVWCINAVA
ncbi:sodium/glutamate symporter [Nocardiopsis alba]|uniref:Sodium/glutamate symporter n=1 Tax=Nocardiopsis alba TaxID=53437 RepID=A0A7K2ITP9_9ACTN|nr:MULTISPECIES: sodium/glutamate symporter [Nocardiopsis]MEC3893764.1 sodium/glutamate symporter [Nocardiopsis sp. LDBS1602]MYR33350.1 sodium/glutamate symporter [Nocardiopsis alba]